MNLNTIVGAKNGFGKCGGKGIAGTSGKTGTNIQR